MYDDMTGMNEYLRMKSIMDNSLDDIISHTVDRLGLRGIIILEWLTIYNGIIQLAEMASEKDQFILYCAAAEVAGRVDDVSRSIHALKLAVSLSPTDLVANFWLAELFERAGKGKEAIQAYETSLKDLSIKSEHLRGFVTAQIRRIRTNGPNRGIGVSGLKYQMW